MSEHNMSVDEKIRIRQELIEKFVELEPLVEDVIIRSGQLDCGGTYQLDQFLEVVKSFQEGLSRRIRTLHMEESRRRLKAERSAEDRVGL